MKVVRRSRVRVGAVVSASLQGEGEDGEEEEEEEEEERAEEQRGGVRMQSTRLFLRTGSRLAGDGQVMGDIEALGGRWSCSWSEQRRTLNNCGAS